MTKLSSSAITPEQYLKSEETSSVQHEYVDGELFAMTGETAGHAWICQQLFRRIDDRLKGSGCHVFTERLKVHVEAANSYYYPDIVVTCEPLNTKSVVLSEPVLIIEVLSRSTQHIDRREKLISYRKIDSLREYVLISQFRMAIEYHFVNENGVWDSRRLGPDDDLVLISLPGAPLRIPVRDIYKDIDFTLTVMEAEEEEYDLSH